MYYDPLKPIFQPINTESNLLVLNERLLYFDPVVKIEDFKIRDKTLEEGDRALLNNEITKAVNPTPTAESSVAANTAGEVINAIDLIKPTQRSGARAEATRHSGGGADKTYTGHFLRKHQLMQNDLFTRRGSTTNLQELLLPETPLVSSVEIRDVPNETQQPLEQVNDSVLAVDNQFKNIEKLFGKTGDNRAIFTQFPRSAKNTGFLFQNLMPLHVYDIKPDLSTVGKNGVVQVRQNLKVILSKFINGENIHLEICIFTFHFSNG